MSALSQLSAGLRRAGRRVVATFRQLPQNMDAVVGETRAAYEEATGLATVTSAKAAAAEAAQRMVAGRATCDEAELACSRAQQRFLDKKAQIEAQTNRYDRDPKLDEAERVYHYRRLQDQLWSMDRREYAAAQVYTFFYQRWGRREKKIGVGYPPVARFQLSRRGCCELGK